jgi:PAS domain S-box-containing protein
MHPDDRSNVINILAEGLKLGLKTGRVECRFRHKNGSWRYVEAIGSNLLEYNGVQSIIINTRDNTERKKIEQKLIKSEEKYRSITNNITDVIAELDLEGTFKYISPQSYDVVGYRPEELIGTINSDYVHPDDLAYLTKAFKDSIQSQQINTLEFRTHHKDGYYVPVSIRSTLVDVEGEKKIFAVLRDITERKKAEQRLRESEEKFRNIAEQSLMGIAILQDNKFHYINKKFAELGGYEPEEIRDWTLKEYLKFIHPDDQFLVAEQARKKQKGDTEVINTYQFRAIKKSGESVWLEIYSSTITYNGRPGDLITAIDITEKKFAEEKIKESEEKYRLISENANDLIAVINEDLIYEYVNKETYYRITGFTEEQLIGKTPFALAHEEDKERALKAIKDAFKTGEGMATLRFQNKNGDYLWLEVKGKTFFDKEKQEKMLVIARDITQRKEAELQVYEFNKLLESIIEERTRELRESEKRLQKKTEEQALLLDNIETQIWYLKDTERYGAVNKAFAKYIGLEPKDLEGKAIRDFRDSSVVNLCITGNREVFNNKMQYRNEEWVKGATGENRYFSVIKTPKLDAIGEVEYVVCTAEDITERKRMEDKLRESETRFRTIAEQSLLGIAIIQDGLIKYTNRALSAINGFSIEEMKNWGVYEFQKSFSPEDLPYLMGRAQAGQEGRGPEILQTPVRIITKKGRTKWLDVYSKSIVYQGKIAIFATMVDISDKKKAEEDLKQSEMKLREQNLELMKLDKLKDDFITIAAHELKTPLISIIGYLELILTRNEIFDAEMKEDLTRVLTNANRLQRYITQLMEVMKIDSKDISLDLKHKNINEIIRECISELDFQIERKNLKIDNSISDELVLNTDSFRISQVFSNLLSNAIKFSNPNEKIEISVVRGNYYYLFKIKDNGIGLEKRDINKLFKKFVTINQNPEHFSAAERGSGLGLYITKGIVEAHGGKIWVESKGKDKGTEVNFTLPL